MLEWPPVSSPELDVFVPLVRQFVTLIDRVDSVEPLAFILSAHSLVAQLYASALRLPSTNALYDTMPDDPDESDDTPVPEVVPDPDHGDLEEWRQLYRQLSAKCGRWDRYREVFNPYDPPDEPEVLGSLADDLSDYLSRSSLRLAQVGPR